MTIGRRSVEYLVGLVHELCKGREKEWVEFNVNVSKSDQIGQYISALANSAALLGKPYAYMVWGVSDRDHAIRGTNFDPSSSKVGNEALENWLLRLLEPRVNFCFYQVPVGGCSVVVLEIEPASHQPVRFEGQEYIRIGSYKKKLKDFPQKERELWRVFDKTSFGDGVAAERVSDDDVLQLLDYPAYFDLFGYRFPKNLNGVLDALVREELIQRCDAGGWNVTNLGAALFARRLEDFRDLRRKAMRVIHYSGKGRIATGRELTSSQGYASGFEGLTRYIFNLLPSNEVIESSIRKTIPSFPEPAVRELVANALIHQDFFITGAGPMLELFDDRVEITIGDYIR